MGSNLSLISNFKTILLGVLPISNSNLKISTKVGLDESVKPPAIFNNPLKVIDSLNLKLMGFFTSPEIERELSN